MSKSMLVNMALDLVAAVLPGNQKPSLKILNKMDFNMKISLVIDIRVSIG